LAVLEKQPANRNMLDRMIQTLSPGEGVFEVADLQAPALAGSASGGPKSAFGDEVRTDTFVAVAKYRE
jgi:hypothetical protein